MSGKRRSKAFREARGQLRVASADSFSRVAEIARQFLERTAPNDAVLRAAAGALEVHTQLLVGTGDPTLETDAWEANPKARQRIVRMLKRELRPLMGRPLNPEAVMACVLTFEAAGLNKEADRAAEEAFRRPVGPESVGVWVSVLCSVAEALPLASDTHLAERLLLRAREIRPHLKQPHDLLQRMYGEAGLPVQQFQAAVAAAAMVPTVANLLQVAALTSGSAPAIDYLRAVLESDPREPQYVLRLAAEYSHQNRFREALELLRDALLARPRSADLRAEYGIVKYVLMDTDEAEREAEAVLGVKPEHPRALACLAAVAARRCRYGEAVALLLRAMNAGAEGWWVLSNLAMCASLAGDKERVLQALGGMLRSNRLETLHLMDTDDHYRRYRQDPDVQGLLRSAALLEGELADEGGPRIGGLNLSESGHKGFDGLEDDDGDPFEEE